ncbi:MAG TPA: hypothetical protein VGS20_01980 [Candidatus Acidoferrales bacterium]|nr:hypothetical protein [Candidatus Acidoferrales bacterium]
MRPACNHPLCRQSVPLVLQNDGLCPLHFLRRVDERCREIHRETLGGLDGRRQAEINDYLAAQALALAKLATSGTRLPDDVRPCILNAFLTLINVCERVARQAAQEHTHPGLPAVPPPLVVTAWRGAGAKS